jgi:hypothetical protein
VCVCVSCDEHMSQPPLKDLRCILLIKSLLFLKHFLLGDPNNRDDRSCVCVEFEVSDNDKFLCVGEPLFRSMIWILGLLCFFVSSVRNPTYIHRDGLQLVARRASVRPAAAAGLQASENADRVAGDCTFVWALWPATAAIVACF